MSLRSDFHAPPAAFRGKPLWSWNARLNQDELTRQIGILAEMGMGGYFMHSRTGLATTYLGPEWLQMIDRCAEESEKLGLESWLYDEDRWPSGAAGGLVTRDPRYRMRYLRCTVVQGDAFALSEGQAFVAAFAAEVAGLNLGAYRRVRGLGAKLAAGESLVVFTVELVQPHDFFNGATYLNTLDPAAVREFLKVTHQRYAGRSGHRFGKSIPGIFTDEPHHGLVMAETPSGWIYPVNSGWATPWTEHLPRHFRARFGHDLRNRLPELFLRLGGERISPVKWQYMELLQSLFLDSFASPIQAWCQRHNLKGTGHILAEELPGMISVTCGSALRYYEKMDVPGMDQLMLGVDSFWLPKLVSSSARQFGKKWILSELYGVTGWQADFATHKELGDWQSFLGVNLRCHHLAWYSMAGESKRDYPASISFQSAWHKEYRAVEEYYGRIHVLLQQGRAVCDLLVVYPVESVWAQVHAKWATWIKNQSPDIAPVDDHFVALFRWIFGARIDFDYGDEEQMERLCRIEPSDGESGPRLRLGEGNYRAVVVGGLETMRGSTLRLLAEFQRAGGTVLFVGPAPTHLDAVRSSSPAAFGQTATAVVFEGRAVARAVAKAVPPPVELSNASPPDAKRPVILQVREEPGAWTIALCNTDAQANYPDVRVRFNGQAAQVQEWDCRTGEVFAHPFRRVRGSLRWDTALGPIGERVFRVATVADETLASRATAKPMRVRRAKGPFDYELDEPNALVIDQFEWRFDGGRWQPSEDILRIDDRVRDLFGMTRRATAMVQPWARPKTKRGTAPTLKLRAAFTARPLSAHSVHLLIEQPTRWQITLNGHAVETGRDCGWFIDPCFRKIPLPAAALKTGRNVLEFSGAFTRELDLEAVYLLGDFGVYDWQTAPVIGALPAKLAVGDVAGQGLPFYTGRIRYAVPVPVGARRLRLPAFDGAVACVSNRAGRSAVLAFPPYETDISGWVGNGETLAVEVVLTRRNLFGPLHLVPKETNVTLPQSFRTEGKSYSLAPMLYPSGLLAPPEIGTFQ